MVPESVPRSYPKTARNCALTVEVRHDLDLDDADAASLNAMVERRPEVGVFVSRAWLSGFLADPLPGVESAIVLLREGAALRGMIPLAIHSGFAHVRVRLLGGGEGSDRVDLLTVSGYELACSDALISWLGRTFGSKAWVFELRDVPLESPLWGALSRTNAGDSFALTVQPREVHTLPFLDLAELWSSSIDANSASRQGGSVDRHRRWLERRGRVRLVSLEDPDEALAAFGKLTEFLHARWSGTATGSALDQPRAIRFHRHVLPLLLQEGRVRMLQMSVDARVVAVLYILATGGWRGQYFTGYDRHWAGRLHLGRLAIAAAIDRAARLGATEFDFLKGAERVKYLWPVRTRGTLNADVYPANTGAQLMRAGVAARDAAAALAKSAARLFRR